MLQSRLTKLMEAAVRTDLQETVTNKGKGKVIDVQLPSSMTPDQIRGEVEDLRSLLPDLEERMEELKAQIEELGPEAPMDESIETLLSAVLSGGKKAAEPVAPAANDLSSLVKKKNKVVPVKIEQTVVAGRDEPKTVPSTKRKSEES